MVFTVIYIVLPLLGERTPSNTQIYMYQSFLPLPLPLLRGHIIDIYNVPRAGVVMLYELGRACDLITDSASLTPRLLVKA
jgi:hypothetical protein